jgi:hypothetical protein
MQDYSKFKELHPIAANYHREHLKKAMVYWVVVELRKGIRDFKPIPQLLVRIELVLRLNRISDSPESL